MNLKSSERRQRSFFALSPAGPDSCSHVARRDLGLSISRFRSFSPGGRSKRSLNPEGLIQAQNRQSTGRLRNFKQEPSKRCLIPKHFQAFWSSGDACRSCMRRSFTPLAFSTRNRPGSLLSHASDALGRLPVSAGNPAEGSQFCLRCAEISLLTIRLGTKSWGPA